MTYACYDIRNPFDLMEPLIRTVTGDMPAFPVDVREVEDGYILEAELPGISADEVSIDLEKNVLTITAEGREAQEGRYVFHERKSGKRQRSFTLTEIDPEGIRAEFHDGLLRLTLPKEKKEMRRIAISGSEAPAEEKGTAQAE